MRKALSISPVLNSASNERVPGVIQNTHMIGKMQILYGGYRSNYL